MTRKFLSDNEIVELVNNLSDLEVESEEELVCCNNYIYDVLSGSLISFLYMKIKLSSFLNKASKCRS